MATKPMSNKAATAKRNSLKKAGKSGIVIKPQNKGKFTAWAKAHGMTVSQAVAAVRKNPGKYSASVRKMATFAGNARRFGK